MSQLLDGDSRQTFSGCVRTSTGAILGLSVLALAEARVSRTHRRPSRTTTVLKTFVTKPRISELIALGKRANVPVFEDQGTGLIFSLEEHGIQEETLLESYRQGCDLIAASGDKLLDGPQAGLLIGRREVIERIKQNPLLRTYRADKLTYAALEATLLDHLSGAENSIPILRMINLSAAEIRTRCQWLADQIHREDLFVDVVPVMSLIGGGTTPEARLSSWALSLRRP
jgi:L-seryl-tRNA(Ser) seleniumtransferase